MRKSVFKVLLIILTTVLLSGNCAGIFIKTWEPPKKYGSMQSIRVLLDNSSGKIVLRMNGLYTVYDINHLVIKKGIDSLIIDPGSIKATIRIVAANNRISYKGREYRGEFLLNPGEKGLVEVIDVLGLEEYLYSVVPSEMPASWPQEALKAQAVCARTYAVKEIMGSRNKAYDLKSDTSSQVYSGMDKEQETSIRAVKETLGVLAIYNGEPIQSFFHSNSGGLTEKPENLWGNKIPYLRSVKSPYCKAGKNYTWDMVIPQSTIDNKFSKYGVGNIKKILVLGRTSSDRVDLMEIRGTENTIRMKGKDFRTLLGANYIKSLRFGIKNDLNGFYIKGLGFGHGIGLSQWGSYEMAKDDHSFKDILKYYFKGITLARMEN